MYYNTTNEKGDKLKEYKEKAKSQQQIILEFLKEHPDKKYTSADLHRILFWNKSPITSVRRVMSDLKKDDIVEKLNSRAPGNYGRDNCLWKLI